MISLAGPRRFLKRKAKPPLEVWRLQKQESEASGLPREVIPEEHKEHKKVCTEAGLLLKSFVAARVMPLQPGERNGWVPVWLKDMAINFIGEPPTK